MKAILESFSGWVAVENFSALLTLEELKIANDWVQEVETFYGSKLFNDFNFPGLVSNKLSAEATRLETVQKLLINDDSYHFREWPFEWARTVTSKTELLEFADIQETSLVEPHWLDIYKKEEV